MHIRTLCLIGLVAISANATADGISNALEKLAKAQPQTPWKAKGALKVDMDCDGIPDYVFLSQTTTSAHIGVVLGRKKTPIHTQTIPIGDPTQDSVCQAPAAVFVESMNYRTPLEPIGDIPGFRSSKSCKTFGLGGGECDVFHFYWNHDKDGLDWWRL